MKRPKLKMVWVKWLDASYQNDTCSQGDLTARVELETVGFLVKTVDRDFITVAHEWYERDKTWRHVSHIPKRNIIKVRRIKA